MEVSMKRNITLSLDHEVIQRARVLAARRGVSLSAMLRDELTRLSQEEDAYEAARASARARLLTGAHLGGGPLPDREELYEREHLR
jgi:hypothetical protein